MAPGKRTRRTASAEPSQSPSKRVRRAPPPKPYDSQLQALEQSQSVQSKARRRMSPSKRVLSPVQEEGLEDEESRLHNQALNASMGLAAEAVAIEEDEDNVDADNEDHHEAEEAEEDEATTAEVEPPFKFSYGLSFRVLCGAKTVGVKMWPSVSSNDAANIVTAWTTWLSKWDLTYNETGRQHTDIYKPHAGRITSSFERCGQLSLVNDLPQDPDVAEHLLRRSKIQLKLWAQQSKKGLQLELACLVVERSTGAPARTPGSQRRAAQRSANETQLAAIRQGTYGTQRSSDDGLFVGGDSPLRRDGMVFDEDNHLVSDVAPADDNFISRLMKQWRCSNRYCSNFGKTCFFTGPDNPEDHCKLGDEIARRWHKAAKVYERDSSKPYCTLLDPGSALTAKLWKSRGKDKLNPYSASVSKQAGGVPFIFKQYIGHSRYGVVSSSPTRRSPSTSPPVLFSSQPDTVEPSTIVRRCFDWLIRDSVFWQNRSADLDAIYDLLVNDKDFDLQQIYNIKATVWVKEYNLREGQYTKLKVGIQKYRHSTAYRQQD
ncbi:hypothetical protein DOTSEDRAFT_48835 [Dothistroma septosporum NZE10]|uniref:Uncharacterized protein n=1 Tax=Dothistroma septosporum (strain NZE10 / CBS 128990) TaxID=675120 RepID=M2XG31_DOTSN|nr:hypothetical protein DOTSEDRAFT_48835 [Dothistroma septosporum NZE10]